MRRQNIALFATASVNYSKSQWTYLCVHLPAMRTILGTNLQIYNREAIDNKVDVSLVLLARDPKRIPIITQ